MIELTNDYLMELDRSSSKGNQLKWKKDDIWYKADYTGYEGLSEYVISNLLKKSTLEQKEIVEYGLEDIKYKYNIYRGCSSEDFLPEGAQLLTLERLFKNSFGEGLNKCIYSIDNIRDRMKFVVEQTQRITGLIDFGKYMSKLMFIDAFFLNEDRHTHNIAVIKLADGSFDYCPLFDNGAGLMADTTIDYPLAVDVYALLPEVKAKTVCRDFDEQLDVAEELYGEYVNFYFTKNDVSELIKKADIYTEDERHRVETIIRMQMDKYSPYFK